MSRPISWLPRLHEISRTVANSVRSHYDRRDVEQLFQLQPRAAQKLIEMLAGVRIGTSRLIDRDMLMRFLERVREADDTVALLEEIRKERATPTRRKVRSLVRRDLDPVSIENLPEGMQLAPGRLEVKFTTVEQLAETMYQLARMLESDGDAFARMFELKEPTLDYDRTNDIRSIFEDLEELERNIPTRISAHLSS